MRSILRYTLAAFFIFDIGTARSQTFVYEFSAGFDGWIGDFADYPAADSLAYELAFNWRALPSPLDTGGHALFIAGNNRSDDLFMFIKKRIPGLLPDTKYRLTIRVSLASRYPTNAPGIGGSPGEGVVVKAGAAIVEPLKAMQSGMYRMNIDKGNQSNPGADMDTIGHVGVSDTTTVYTLIARSNAAHPFAITTPSDGNVWICIGTDSGFEGMTALYYTRIELSFNSVSGIQEDRPDPRGFLLKQNHPNPFRSSTTIAYALGLRSSVSLKLFDPLGREVAVLADDVQDAGDHAVAFSANGLPGGMYLYRLAAGRFVRTRKLLVIQ